MDGDNRQEIKTIKVYKFERIIKATKLQVSHIKGSTTTFKIIEPKTNKEHYVCWSQKLQDWQCDCWHYANRTAPNKVRWGYCSHIMGLLYKKAVTTFEKEAIREVTIKNNNKILEEYEK
jgi:hypothetical protein